MNRSEHDNNPEETTKTSSKRGFFYYFDIFYRVSKALIIFFIVTLLVGGSLGAGAAIGYFASLVHSSEIPEYEEMEAQIDDFVLKSTMYYAGGEVISDVRSDLIRTPVDLDNISPTVVDAIVATEDEYFFEHNGIVPKAVARALVQDLTNSSSSSGGSTLTQQLIKQQLVGNEVSHSRKANEILLAMRLENYMSKEDILQAYLNISPFGRNNKGQNIAGVQEAAQGIFGVAAADLSLPQAAFIAGLPQSPIVYSPYTQTGEVKEDQSAGLERKNEVLFRMYREGYIAENKYNEAVNYDLSQDFIPKADNQQDSRSYVYDLALEESRELLMQQFAEADDLTMEDLNGDTDLYNQYFEQADSALINGGYKVYTTIDRDLHNSVEQVVKEQADSLGSERSYTWKDADGVSHTDTMPIQVSGSVIDNATGKVLAFIGGRDYKDSNYNRAFDSERSPGSIIKPLATYGPALDTGLITPATIVPDTDVSITLPTGKVYEPTNAIRTTNRWMTAREALTVSQNIPTIKIYNELVKQVNPVSYMTKMGIGEDVIPAEDYVANPATAIGGVSGGAAPVDLISAFSTIANNGTHVDPYVIEKIENSTGEAIYQHEQAKTQVWSPQTNFLLLDILRGVHTEGTARGTISQLNFNSDWISKTGTSGTSDKVNDIWYVGSTPNITFGTWIGYDNQVISLEDEFGQSPSLRNRNFWAKVVNQMYTVRPELLGAGKQFQQPSNIVQRSVLTQTGMLPGTVNLPNGGTSSVSDDTFTEYFNTAHLPKPTVYDFALGATDAELSKFWNAVETSDSNDDQESESSDDAEEPSPPSNREETPENDENESKPTDDSSNNNNGSSNNNSDKETENDEKEKKPDEEETKPPDPPEEKPEDKDPEEEEPPKDNDNEEKPDEEIQKPESDSGNNE
ncbi:transglycosylase domain-containing protein [Marinilactibacillus psychrotolerans]|uniref:Transglycosylase n=1 Tax=Marinilactibacillus psychrotolerans TaxID=191770 RepID=A0AAV3WYD8_9LACT|nr:transglycosylase domain-containing protein [Marinilactibacillus psychrotolerans]GEL67801.1 penicillin-binding protein 1B [Marinilactibacillus psychrotolerans]GEQ36759.1 transglycosylase [Marinilactibacillus psychrotolerans]SDD19245.1 penicillin-binding protein [Marinilactibacillus psychrotolerans]